MKIPKIQNDININLNHELKFGNDLGWSENFQDFEKLALQDLINPVENYETVRYIHEPYSGISVNSFDKQTDIWYYFYFISGATYVQNYEALGITLNENIKSLTQLKRSFFRLEFYKTPNNEPPTRFNRRFVFARNLAPTLGEKYFYTGNSINADVSVPVFMGSNYRNKEAMYLFWFQDDSVLEETTLTGNTFWMTAKFFNAKDGTIIDFTNKDLSVDNSGLIDERRGVNSNPIKFYEKGISGGDEVDESSDMYYRLTLNKTDYSYQISYFT